MRRKKIMINRIDTVTIGNKTTSSLLEMVCFGRRLASIASPAALSFFLKKFIPITLHFNLLLLPLAVASGNNPSYLSALDGITIIKKIW